MADKCIYCGKAKEKVALLLRFRRMHLIVTPRGQVFDFLPADVPEPAFFMCDACAFICHHLAYEARGVHKSKTLVDWKELQVGGATLSWCAHLAVVYSSPQMVVSIRLQGDRRLGHAQIFPPDTFPNQQLALSVALGAWPHLRGE